jgi:predicted Zn-dependent protease
MLSVMGGDLSGLRARSEHLASVLADEEALAVNRAILDAAPGDPVATNRLGAGLIASGRAPEAVEVYEAGLEANKGNAIMLNRLTQARHAAGRPAPKAPAARRRAKT